MMTSLAEETLLGFFFLIFGLICGRLGAFLVPYLSGLFEDEPLITYQFRPGIRTFFSFFRPKNSPLPDSSSKTIFFEEELLKGKSFLEGFKLWQKKWAGFFPLSSILVGFWKGNSKIELAFIELITAFLFWLLYLKFWGSFIFWEYLIFVWASIIACFIDLRKMILPDQITLTGMVLALLGAWINPERQFLEALAGTLSVGVAMWLIAILYFLTTKREGIGGGDVKLLAWIGALLGWKAILFIIMVSSLIGILMALVLFTLFSSSSTNSPSSSSSSSSASTKENETSSSWIAQPFAFGPSLVLASFLFIFLKDSAFSDSLNLLSFYFPL